MASMDTNLPSLLASIKEGVIDLGWGHPSPRLHPLVEIREASQRLLSREDPAPLQYGATQGFGPFLESLAKFLSGQPAYGMSVDPHHLFLTAGASQGIDLACTLFANSGDTVVVEEPTYFIIEKMFRERRLIVTGVPTDSAGMVVAELEKSLRGGLKPALVYTIPSFQNPTGASMSPERRAHLVSLADEFDFHILADEVYQLVHFEQLPPKPIITFDDNSRVISFGSFSKILAPGLRTGWIHSSNEIVGRFADAALTFSGGGFNHYAATLVREVSDLGLLDENVNRLRNEYEHRASVMQGSLQAEFGEEIGYVPPAGGYYFWLTFPEGFDSDLFLPFAEREGVSFRPGNAFSESRRFSQNLRLTYTLFETEELREGIRRLAAAYNKMQATVS